MKFVSAILTLFTSVVQAAQLTAAANFKVTTKKCLSQISSSSTANDEAFCATLIDSLEHRGDSEWKPSDEQELGLSESEFHEVLEECGIGFGEN